MSIAKAYTAQLSGLETEIITVEVDISNGLNAFSIVGLGDRSVEESKDRVSAAIKNSGFISPKQKNQKVVISLAPADVRKEGPSFDLAIAIAYLAATGDIEMEGENALFLGELSLDGSIRKIRGLLPMLIRSRALGFTTAFIPLDNADEASLAKDLIIYTVSSLDEVIGQISRQRRIEPLKPRNIDVPAKPVSHLDMSSVRGNETAKRALEIAAAGAHNIVLSGPPGTGKTLLAKCLPSILPPLTYDHALEVTGIHSAAGYLSNGLICQPPFRTPHHTSSHGSVLGGGGSLRPGEITLAHRGVLFLDEFPEFDRRVIESLRQPLEDKVVTVARAKGTATFPAQCILIASMNPCRCGRGKDNGCTCPPHIREAYSRRISAAVLDRIDLWVDVHKVDYEKLRAADPTSESSEQILGKVSSARKIQKERYEANSIKKDFNSEIGPDDIDALAPLREDARRLLAAAAEKLRLSGRSFHRVIKVARTIADLAGSKEVKREHVLEALQYRKKS